MSEPTDHKALITEGQRVVEAEAAALSALADAMGNGLGAPFANAVDTILAATGRVIVSGMGKSGHIARKIAATLSSTGTPAHFVHPAEASHGDLGMMATGDVALLLSNSGETPELADMIAYTRRFSIPLIGIAGRAGSTLLERANVALLLPEVGEAGDASFVPTTSTTMTLALGDAIAIVLMQHRRFTPAHFREFHPGGKLGAQLARVVDLMHRGDSLPLVPTQTQMSDALLVISQKGFGVVGVTDGDHNLIGVVTDGDLRRHMSGLLNLCVDDVMTQLPSTIAVDALAEEALAQMNARKITCLFVTEEKRPVGILHVHDCLRAGIV